MGIFSNWFGTNNDDDLPEILSDIDINHGLSIGVQDTDDFYDAHITNPATGLPMTGGLGSFDIGGSPYGFDMNDDNSFD